MTASSTTRKKAAPRPRKTAAKKPAKVAPDPQAAAEQKAAAELAERYVVLHAEGQDWRIPRAAMNDFEVLRDVRAIERGEATRYADVLEKLLEPAELQRAMELLRDPDTGRVPLDRGYLFTQRLISAHIPKS